MSIRNRVFRTLPEETDGGIFNLRKFEVTKFFDNRTKKSFLTFQIR